MSRFLAAACLAALLAACGSFTGTIANTPDRDVVGVAVHQPSAGDDAVADPVAEARLDWKASQICTLGSDVTRQTVETAENQAQIVDRRLICRPYVFSVLGVPLGGIVPF